METTFYMPKPANRPLLDAIGSLATAEVFTHKGEYLQGPIPLVVDGRERYTMGVFSLLDDLNSAFVDVRAHKHSPIGSHAQYQTGDDSPAVSVHANGWNDGEVKIVTISVVATWKWLKIKEKPHYEVYGYHDILVGAGSGSSSALIEAAIIATAREHGRELDYEEIYSIHAEVESGSDALTYPQASVVAGRLPLTSPVKVMGWRPPSFKAITWSTGDSVSTGSVKFSYTEPEMLLWRVRWASVERAVRTGDSRRLATLAMASADENQKRNISRDLPLLIHAVSNFGALGYSVAHTGSYHTALFPSTVERDLLDSFSDHVRTHSKHLATEVRVFDTTQAAERRK
ncbi:uncharacterized protein involved in propanediol utilization [Arthrobacter sp. 1088]|uniref:GHMP family kinase ATP-binding protein n=1 Tax=Arthrobacter sp. 1088 TaxID=2817768 RepID=UPI002866DC51|nr:hypothetical protein [Arthrobacter sp. 1088]MDR6687896.1 uncharacterized protein involved in propanediol utilization [Arthrobacter sp. 1088]